MKFTVVTSNENKAREVAAFFTGVAEVAHTFLEIPEFRDNDVGVIAEEKARYAWDALHCPLIVDDTGFFVTALNGFPGPYAAYVLDTIGMEGILRLLEGADDRSAYFETAIAYADDSGIIRVFRGVVEGTIVSPRGEGGFGYDPIFSVDGRTFAERTLAEKASMSHRGRALAALRQFMASDGSSDGAKEPNC
ncbi:RdgB/HAM1 family non-canonical purine NTP pyrophosphatase [Methanogenium organophilum]|uniref:RdgB/HAM1 family non-canonical purine NTP pyrophosphatase n=1 Tax=Methanogenium organophilum TaxID=2199 RepID=A0A9X9T6S6_METOG|nr:RdgB/HAM1 family non-canonical purine NTP pyrophosphatase [Methanogenium organophilum]WAI00324.1 RdgB/HAM1 family non-canonical purine NTP pyrophosphatase [Methanogenium organophilum]